MSDSHNLDRAISTFALAKAYVEQTPFSDEIDWQRKLDFAEFSESDLLREAAWVVLCSGFREKAVRNVFDSISLCFCDWESSASIVNSGEVCWKSAIYSFNNTKKLFSIYNIAVDIHDNGFDYIRSEIIEDPISSLQRFPFIGTVTSQHLAKNLGFDIAKDDRHLLRFSNLHGFDNANDLCAELSIATGEKCNVIDIILWRYLADSPDARISQLLS